MEIGIWGSAGDSGKVGGRELVQMKRNHENANMDSEDLACITIAFKGSMKKSSPYINFLQMISAPTWSTATECGKGRVRPDQSVTCGVCARYLRMLQFLSQTNAAEQMFDSKHLVQELDKV